jgi:hypothetical protein
VIRFVADVSCDHHPRCEEKATFGVRAVIDPGCSPMGGPPCKAELEADIYHESGWHELPEGKVCCPQCWAEPERFEPETLARELREYDWAPHCWAPNRGGMNPEIVPKLKAWAEQLLSEPDAWEATTDGGYPRCGWGPVCGFEMRTSFGSRPMPHVAILGWQGISWNALSSVSELRRKPSDEGRVPA